MFLKWALPGFLQADVYSLTRNMLSSSQAAFNKISFQAFTSITDVFHFHSLLLLKYLLVKCHKWKQRLREDIYENAFLLLYIYCLLMKNSSSSSHQSHIILLFINISHTTRYMTTPYYYTGTHIKYNNQNATNQLRNPSCCVYIYWILSI